MYLQNAKLVNMADSTRATHIYQRGSNDADESDCVKSITVPLENWRNSEERDASVLRVG